MIQQVLTLIRRTGPLVAAAMLFSYAADLVFDLRYGTHTAAWVNLERLDIRSENLGRAVDYQPTQFLPLRRLLTELLIPRDKVFTDLGCGKGRVLLLAAEVGFLDVRGVDFSAELCDLAVANCAKYKRKKGSHSVFQLVHSDVVDFPMRDTDVFYLFNPFDDHVLKIVLQRIVDSLAERPRQIWIIYRNPVHEAVLARNRLFSKMRDFLYLGSDFAVYTSAAPAVAKLVDGRCAASDEHRG